MLLYQVEYQPSDSEDDTEWLRGPLVSHKTTSHSDYLQALVEDLKGNTFYDFRVRPQLRDSDGHWTNASASPRSSAYRTRCSGTLQNFTQLSASKHCKTMQ